MISELKIIISSLFVILLAVFSYANDENISSEQVLTYNQIKSKVLYTKYISIPEIVYTNQRFDVTINSNILISYEDRPYKIHTFINQDNKDISLINKDIIWTKIDKNNFQTNLQFKVLKDKVVLPEIKISLIDQNNEIIDESTLKKEKITYRKIAVNQKKYSQVIASNLMIVSVKTKQYTNNQLIHVLAITAIDSNLEDFYLLKYENQGQKVLKNLDNSQMLYYYVIGKRGEKNIEFNYYNTKLNKFIDINLAINLSEELVSTQTDLNPYENDMYIYKVIAVSIIVLFFLMVYFFKREFFFLFFAILFMTLLLYMVYPNKKILVKKDTKVYILPTSNSTVFMILEKDKKGKVLIKKDKFSKILFENRSIGWIKNG